MGWCWCWWLALGRWSWPWWVVRWRLTSTRVRAPSQASRRHASGASGPAHPGSPPTAPGWPSRLSVHDHRQLGSDAAALGQLTGLQVAAGQLDQGISAALGAAAVIVGVGGAGQGVQGGQQGLAGRGLQ